MKTRHDTQNMLSCSNYTSSSALEIVIFPLSLSINFCRISQILLVLLNFTICIVSFSSPIILHSRDLLLIWDCFRSLSSQASKLSLIINFIIIVSWQATVLVKKTTKYVNFPGLQTILLYCLLMPHIPTIRKLLQRCRNHNQFIIVFAQSTYVIINRTQLSRISGRLRRFNGHFLQAVSSGKHHK